jgi:ABC-type Co2+ transport system permease subunit
MAFSVSIAIFFSLFGAYSKEEMKRERNGGSVILGMTLIAAFIFYFVVFYLPCNAPHYHGTTPGKARLGEAMIYFITNYKFLFILFISGLSGLIFYCTALALKLIKDGK